MGRLKGNQLHLWESGRVFDSLPPDSPPIENGKSGASAPGPKTAPQSRALDPNFDRKNHRNQKQKSKADQRRPEPGEPPRGILTVKKVVEVQIPQAWYDRDQHTCRWDDIPKDYRPVEGYRAYSRINSVSNSATQNNGHDLRSQIPIFSLSDPESGDVPSEPRPGDRVAIGGTLLKGMSAPGTWGTFAAIGRHQIVIYWDNGRMGIYGSDQCEAWRYHACCDLVDRPISSQKIAEVREQGDEAAIADNEQSSNLQDAKSKSSKTLDAAMVCDDGELRPGHSAIAKFGNARAKVTILEVVGVTARVLYEDGAKPWIDVGHLEKVREQPPTSSVFPNSGTIEIKTIKGHQYRYLRYRQDGRLRSKYLGKAENHPQITASAVDSSASEKSM